jgi:tetratricopeptide (TPR) repeat protein
VGPGYDPATWPRWQELLPHALTVVDADRAVDPAAWEPAWLLDRAAEYRAARGEFREALPLAQQAHALHRARLGDDHPDTLSSATNLAIRLADLDEHEQARALTEDTLTRQRRILGDDHPETLRSAHNLANRLADLGEHDQARTLIEDTLSRRRRILGDDHPDTLRTAAALAENPPAFGETL